MPSNALSTLFVEFRASTQPFANDVAAISKEVRAFDKVLAPIKNTLKDIGVGLTAAGASITAPLIAMTKAAANYGDELAKAAQRTGASVEELAKLKFAAEQSGASFADVATGLRVLSKNLDASISGSKQQQKLFSELGISVKDAGGNIRPMNDLLLDIADRFAVMGDGAEKSALAVELFGRGGTALIPTLNEGSAGLARMGDQATRLGLVISKDAAKASEEFNDTLDQAKLAIEGLGNSIGRVLLPVLTEYAGKARDAIASVTQLANEHPNLTKAIFGTGVALTGAGGLLLGLTGVLTVAPHVIGSIQKITAAVRFVSGAFTALGLASSVLSGIGIAAVAVGAAFAAWKFHENIADMIGLGDEVRNLKGAIADAAFEAAQLGKDLLRIVGIDVGEIDELTESFKRLALAIPTKIWEGLILGAQQTRAHFAHTIDGIAEGFDLVAAGAGTVVDAIHGIEKSTDVLDAVRAKNLAAAASFASMIASFETASRGPIKGLAELWKNAGAELPQLTLLLNNLGTAEDEAAKRLRDSFEASLKPATDLAKEIIVLSQKFSTHEIVSVYADKILSAAAAQREHGFAIPAVIKGLEEEARAMKTNERLLEVFAAAHKALAASYDQLRLSTGALMQEIQRSLPIIAKVEELPLQRVGIPIDIPGPSPVDTKKWDDWRKTGLEAIDRISNDITRMFTDTISHGKSFWEAFKRLGTDALASIASFGLNELIHGLLDPFAEALGQLIDSLKKTLANAVRDIALSIGKLAIGAGQIGGGILGGVLATRGTGGFGTVLAGAGGVTAGVIGGTVAAAGTAGVAGGIGFGGGVATLVAATGPLIPIAAAAAAGMIILGRAIGRAHIAANDFVRKIQNPLGTSLTQLIDANNELYAAGRQTYQGALDAKAQISQVWTEFKLQAAEFAQQGKDQAKVAAQGLATLTPIFERAMADLGREIADLTPPVLRLIQSMTGASDVIYDFNAAIRDTAAASDEQAIQSYVSQVIDSVKGVNNLATALDILAAAGTPAEVIIDRLGPDIEEFNETLSRLGLPIPEIISAFHDLIAAGQAVGEQLNPIIESFLDALKPADALNKEIGELASTFDVKDIVAVYAEQIIAAADAQRKHGKEVTGFVADLEQLARDFLKTPTELSQSTTAAATRVARIPQTGLAQSASRQLAETVGKLTTLVNTGETGGQAVLDALKEITTMQTKPPATPAAPKTPFEMAVGGFGGYVDKFGEWVGQLPSVALPTHAGTSIYISIETLSRNEINNEFTNRIDDQVVRDEITPKLHDQYRNNTRSALEELKAILGDFGTVSTRVPTR